MRPIWKGSLSFGLVTIPVSLYSAVEQHSFGFRLLCSQCKTPIRFKRWCKNCKKEISWNSVLKGVEISKDEFVALTKEEIEKLKPEKSDLIEIMAFVNSYLMPPIYFDKHYYLGPEKPKEKAYFLFREVLQSTAQIAIGKLIMHEKEHMCQISAYKAGLLLTTLNYPYEVRDIGRLDELKEQLKLSREELGLARELVNKMHMESFDISRFRDRFSEKLRALVGRMQKGQRIAIKKGMKPRKNLVEALRASIGEK